MNRTELLGSPESSIEVKEGEKGYEVRTLSYSVLFHRDTPYIDLCDANGNPWMEILKASRIVTSESADVTYEFGDPSYEIATDGSVTVSIPSLNEAGLYKEQVWICRDDYIETFVKAETSGKLQTIELLGGAIVSPNMFGESMSRRHFESIYNPQPSEREQAIFSAAESTHITTSGMWKPGRRREFLITPFSYGFHRAMPNAANKSVGGDWLMASISTPIENQNMTEYSYIAREDGFSLNLQYDATDINESSITSPSLLLHFSPEPLKGLEHLKKHAATLGHLPVIPKPKAVDWHRGTTFVSWGHQLELERRYRENNLILPVRHFASEAFVTRGIDILSGHDISIDKIVIDDKWQEQYGTNTPDSNKWPDMSRFNATQHSLGRHVLLWVKLFDPEGLPPELCILDAHGRAIASDPTNPAYIEILRSQVHTMLSAQEIDADGLKLDFLAQLPHGSGLRWHGSQRGHAALHSLIKHIYDEAKSTKIDSLITAQVVSPWFGDAVDQIRLNDTNERHPVVKTMGSRALLATTLLPDHSLDPDGWPMRSRQAWLQYIDAQPDLTGTVTTHFTESINGQLLRKRDYARLAKAIQRTKTTN